MKKLLLIIFLTLSLLHASKPLNVGMELAYPPFEMSQKDGTPSGISVDFAKALGEYLGREVIIKNIAWDGLIPSLKTKKVDIIISSMTITEQRSKTVLFSKPYARANLAILTHKNSNILKIDDLNQKGKKVAVKKGTSGHIYAMSNLQNASLLIFDKENSAVLEVLQKKADGFLYDQLTIFRNWKNHEDKSVALLEPFQENPEEWGVAMRKVDVELKNRIDDFIELAKKDGTFDRLAKKYLTEAKKTFEELGIPFFF